MRCEAPAVGDDTITDSAIWHHLRQVTTYVAVALAAAEGIVEVEYSVFLLRLAPADAPAAFLSHLLMVRDCRDWVEHLAVSRCSRAIARDRRVQCPYWADSEQD